MGPTVLSSPLSQKVLKHTGETVTSSWSAHIAQCGLGFLKLPQLHASFSFLVKRLLYPLNYDTISVNMLPLSKICIQVLRALPSIEERYQKHASVSVCELH